MQYMFGQKRLLLVLFIKQIYKVYRNSSTLFCKKHVKHLLTVYYFKFQHKETEKNTPNIHIEKKLQLLFSPCLFSECHLM